MSWTSYFSIPLDVDTATNNKYKNKVKYLLRQQIMSILDIKLKNTHASL